MVNIHLKDTGINITCETSEELYRLYHNLSIHYTFIVNGVELEKRGPIGNNSYFAGYTRDYFKKMFFEE